MPLTGELETDCLEQDAIMFSFIGINRYGRREYTDPVALKVRWEDRHIEVEDPELGLIEIKAVVVVDRVIADGSLMWKGTLNEWNESGSAGNPGNEVMQVRGRDNIPDLFALAYRRVVYLTKYGEDI